MKIEEIAIAALQEIAELEPDRDGLSVDYLQSLADEALAEIERERILRG